MGQGSIIKLLEKENRPVTTNFIIRKLGCSRSCVTTSLKKLRKHKEINAIPVRLNRIYRTYLYYL